MTSSLAKAIPLYHSLCSLGGSTVADSMHCNTLEYNGNHSYADMYSHVVVMLFKSPVKAAQVSYLH